MRGIWHSRNKLVFEDQFTGPTQVYNAAVQALKAFREAVQRMKVRPTDVTTGTDLVKWKTPDEGWLAVNFDAALDVQNKRVGLGFIIRNSSYLSKKIIRNSSGEIIYAGCERIYIKTEAVMAEVLALRKAIETCLDLGFSKCYLKVML